MAESQDPLIGKVLSGRFRVLEPLGVGGMGKVYKAMQTPLDRLVALKVLNPRYGTDKDPGFERRFFLEAAMTAKLHHPNTITVHDYGRTDDGVYFIAMEYAEGDTLLQVLQREKRLPWQRAFHIGAQICRSLREAHKLGIVHRDLKPANVMLLHEETGSDMVKVLDFGLVKSFTPDGPLSPTDTGLTQAGVLLGSPLYMAPEQARGELDPRSDVYSLGVLLYQCIAGRTPFQGKESIDVIVKHIREAPPDVRDFAPELPEGPAALVMRCLEKEPADRYQSMDEVLEAMKAAGAQFGLSGAFTDPRSLAFSGGRSKPNKVPTDPGVPRPAASPGPAQPLGQGSEPSTSVELSFGERRGFLQSRMKVFVAILAVAGLAVGVGTGLWSRGAKDPAVQPPPKVEPPKVEPPKVEPPRVEPPPPATRQVVFVVGTQPTGAQVFAGDKRLGSSPLRHAVEVPVGQPARLDLRFQLDGYQDVSASFSGDGPEVQVAQALARKKKTGRKNPPGGKTPSGYKEDPYQ